MKKILLLFTMFLCFIAVKASEEEYEFPYLIIQTSKGPVAFEVNSLEMTFDQSNLLVKCGTDTKTFDLSDLNKMYFSSTSTGISDISDENGMQIIEAYQTNGLKIGAFSSIEELRSKCGKGVFVLKNGNKVCKILIK